MQTIPGRIIVTARRGLQTTYQGQRSVGLKAKVKSDGRKDRQTRPIAIGPTFAADAFDTYLVATKAMLGVAETPLLRFVVDVLHNLSCNKSTAYNKPATSRRAESYRHQQVHNESATHIHNKRMEAMKFQQIHEPT